MTVTSAMVLSEAGAGADDGDRAQAVLDEATAYVDDYITQNTIDITNRPVPDAIRDAAVLAAAVDLFARRKAPFGQTVTTSPDGTPVSTRLGADPLAAARPKLRPWCYAIGFAVPDDDCDTTP